MTKKEKERYDGPELLRDILQRTLAGRKFQLDCGHYVCFGHFLGNDITIINGKRIQNNLLTLWTLNNDYVSALRR